MTHEGTVVSVNISEERGTSKHPIGEATIDRHGVVGDAHAGAGTRQVSLLAEEHIEQFATECGRPFRCGDFAENLTTRGLDLRNTALLDRFAIGDVALEVTELGKRCHGDGCAIFREVGRCVMPRDGIFCRVLSGGGVRPGDTIAHVERALRIRVMTLSDRASRGDYADRSGPRIKERLEEFFRGKRWHVAIDGAILPDDAGRFRRELESACAEAVDVVFTTGGTGIGPRDVAPDIVAELADRLIPGIMEHIRVTFGADHPNALLSRSVAAVLGQTLVYTLPGSTKAVDEYVGEILKTLEHAVLMIHAVDAH